MSQMNTMLIDLKASGSIPESATLPQISSCVYGRMNTHLYEFRPKVRGWFVGLTSLECTHPHQWPAVPAVVVLFPVKS